MADAGARASKPADALHINIRKHGSIAEWRGKEILARCGVPVPRGRLATSLAEAHVIAQEIGFPVVLKAQADALAHKSEAGGVIVGIADAAQLDAAEARMVQSVSAAAPHITLDGMLVETLAPKGGLEMIVGARRDPQWGPVLLVGLGGVWTEALHDVRLLPADAGAGEIAHELEKLKGAALLHGLRGAPARDVAAFAGVAAKIGALMLANPDIVEIDVNPVNVYAIGEGALALDALIVMA